MRFTRVAIEGIAIEEAPDEVTSASIEAQILAKGSRTGMSPGLLETLTGVRARRCWKQPIELGDIGASVARRLLDQCQVHPNQIGVVINTSVTKDVLEPSVASSVHGRLGLRPDCLNFDISNACLAFLDGMTLASMMIERGEVDYALIVDVENSHRALESTVARLQNPTATSQDLKDNFATLTLGSGVATMLLCRSDLATTSHRFRGGISRAATQWNHLCRGNMEEMITDATQLLKAGVELANSTYQEAKRALDWENTTLDAVIMHQVGAIHMSTLRQTLDIEHIPAHVTYKSFGNMGPAAIPFTLQKAIEAGDIFEGDTVALMGIGSGLNCAMMSWRH